MSKQVIKADKMVTKATTLFSDAVVEVEKANELLKKAIERDSFEISAAEAEIEEIKIKIAEIKADREEKGSKLASNKKLIEQLTQFVPQQK